VAPYRDTRPRRGGTKPGSRLKRTRQPGSVKGVDLVGHGALTVRRRWWETPWRVPGDVASARSSTCQIDRRPSRRRTGIHRLGRSAHRSDEPPPLARAWECPGQRSFGAEPPAIDSRPRGLSQFGDRPPLGEEQEPDHVAANPDSQQSHRDHHADSHGVDREGG
jgi:hypothetical protein